MKTIHATFTLQEDTVKNLDKYIKRKKKTCPRISKSATVDRAIAEFLKREAE